MISPLDTCVVTECLKPGPKPAVQAWLDRNDTPGTFLNVLVIDSVLAATAMVHRLALVTRNTMDFQTLGVEVANPWPDHP